MCTHWLLVRRFSTLSNTLSPSHWPAPRILILSGWLQSSSCISRFKSGPSSVMPEWKSVRLGRTWNRIHRSLVSIAKSGPRVHLRSGLLRVEESYSPALADDDLDGCHYVISCQLRGCNIQLLSTVLGESFHRMSNFCLFPARRTSYFSTARTKQSRSCLFSSFNCTVLLFVGPSSASPVSTLGGPAVKIRKIQILARFEADATDPHM